MYIVIIGRLKFLARSFEAVIGGKIGADDVGNDVFDLFLCAIGFFVKCGIVRERVMDVGREGYTDFYRSSIGELCSKG